MTVGFHSPLPPARTGVADYSAALLNALRHHGRVDVDARQASIHLYHLGNNQLHRPMYDRAMTNPGVVVLHDAVLQHFYLGALDESAYVEEYSFNYGEWERAAALELYRNRARSSMETAYFDRPMLRRVAEKSLAVIVHNAAAAQAVREHVSAARVIEIPHFYECRYPPEPDAGSRMRARLGIPETSFVFGVFGHLRESKRLFAILGAFDRLHRECPATALLIAGDFVSPDLKRAMADQLDRPGIVHTGYLNERDFWRAADAVDCCLNLRYPTAGETSGIGVRLMGIGKPVFFTEGREIENIPEDACIRIASGEAERAELLECMRMVVELPHIARGIGARAASHVARNHSLACVADQYWNALCALAADLPR